MEMKIETIPTSRIAYIRKVGPYGSANKQTMENLKKWAAERNLLSTATIFGMAQDNPETTPPEECRYDACIVLTDKEPVDHQVSEGVLNGGTYLVCKVEHTTKAVQQAWADIIPFAAKNNYQIEQKPILERYTAEMIRNEFCELCVPVSL
ncbi:DNA gyrase inhibitor [Gracilibacillus oryzae]|uniref:DNA gyrase inhibitor n=1 Tax=Gracilibacillus oryzae TaxID=1672701 RepID=A0A7C8GUA6_9BACI|nr:GyrI-like domain-containing protein [Gracilibacillus oryzae]KAB8138057.1 DNA gyrase inhibitor [Gracilibacillus oryzae]